MSTRRALIRSLMAGSSMLPAILTDLLAAESHPLAPKAPHFTPKAKRVIFLFLTGGVSHVDSFDPKPGLKTAYDAGRLHREKEKFLPSIYPTLPPGPAGFSFTSIFPQLNAINSELCLVRSLYGDHNDHFQAVMGIHTGSVSVKRPSIGSWVSYGLGTENRNLPSFVVLAPHLPYAGSQVWSSDFLPALHNGTRVLGGSDPVPNLQRRAASDTLQRSELDLLAKFNKMHAATRPGDTKLAARVQSFETAFGMQGEMPQVLDFQKESDATLKLYGLERGQTTGFAWQCLVARRMAERGVRFIELIDTGSTKNWDVHGDVSEMAKLARDTDGPIAALIKDLKSRGMLDETLVVCTTEFGRTPFSANRLGREHYNKVYSSWLAGGGIKAGLAWGASDEVGLNVAENGVHVHDFHATILHCLGFDHTRLTFRHAGRDFRLTDVGGTVVKELLA